jgi:hypothetical protein
MKTQFLRKYDGNPDYYMFISSLNYLYLSSDISRFLDLNHTRVKTRIKKYCNEYMDLDENYLIDTKNFISLILALPNEKKYLYIKNSIICDLLASSNLYNE